MRCERFRLIECVMSHVTGETVRGEARGGHRGGGGQVTRHFRRSSKSGGRV